MNRRGFLKLFAGAAAGAIVVPKTSYFFAPKGGWVANGQGIYLRPPFSPWAGTLMGIQAAMDEAFTKYAVMPSAIAISKGDYGRLVDHVCPKRRIAGSVKDLTVMGVKIVESPYLEDGQRVAELRALKHWPSIPTHRILSGA